MYTTSTIRNMYIIYRTRSGTIISCLLCTVPTARVVGEFTVEVTCVYIDDSVLHQVLQVREPEVKVLQVFNQQRCLRYCS